jgi:hypothetical protein
MWPWDLLLAMVVQEADLGVFAVALVGRADLLRRFTGQTFLCLALASCFSGTNDNRHHRSTDLAILTSLASLADFASLEDFSSEVVLALAAPSTLSSSMEVALTAPLTSSSSLEVALLSLELSSANLLMTSQGMALLSPEFASTSA